VLVVDATEMELKPGDIRLVDDRFVAERFIMTTHDLPVSYLIASLRETVPEVRLLGIQPSLVAFGYPMSATVDRAVRDIHAALKSGAAPDAWPTLDVPE
jgi:hydrogenase 3 maturation protease